MLTSYTITAQWSKPEAPFTLDLPAIVLSFLPSNKIAMTSTSLSPKVSSQTLSHGTHQLHFVCLMILSSSACFLPLGSRSLPPHCPSFAVFANLAFSSCFFLLVSFWLFDLLTLECPRAKSLEMVSLSLLFTFAWWLNNSHCFQHHVYTSDLHVFHFSVDYPSRLQTHVYNCLLLTFTRMFNGLINTTFPEVNFCSSLSSESCLTLYSCVRKWQRSPSNCSRETFWKKMFLSFSYLTSNFPDNSFGYAFKILLESSHFKILSLLRPCLKALWFLS